MVELWNKSMICFSRGYVLLYLAGLAAFMGMIEGGEQTDDSERKRLHLVKD